MKSKRLYLQFIAAILIFTVFCTPASGEEIPQLIVNIIAKADNIPADSDIYNSELYDFDESEFAFSKRTPKLRLYYSNRHIAENDWSTAINEAQSLSNEKNATQYIIFAQNPFILSTTQDSEGNVRYSATPLDDYSPAYRELVNDISNSKIYESDHYTGEAITEVYGISLIEGIAIYYSYGDSATVCFYAQYDFADKPDDVRRYIMTDKAFSSLLWQYNDYIDFRHSDITCRSSYDPTFESFLQYNISHYNQYIKTQNTRLIVCTAALGVLLGACVTIFIVHIIKKRKANT